MSSKKKQPVLPWSGHPATFSATVLDAIADLSKGKIRPGDEVLDFNAGTGKIHQFQERLGWRTVGVEIEPEGAIMHPDTICGDATDLPGEWTGRFRAWVTSVTFGTRMGDHHNAQEKCKPCGGTGMVNLPGRNRKLVDMVCEPCGGEGRRTYKRNTYKHSLPVVRDLHPNNSGQTQWGGSKADTARYEALHRKMYAEAARVATHWGILDISDHIRKGETMPVVDFHVAALREVGFYETKRVPVKIPRLGHGANRDARAECSWVIAFRKR